MQNNYLIFAVTFKHMAACKIEQVKLSLPLFWLSTDGGFAKWNTQEVCLFVLVGKGLLGLNEGICLHIYLQLFDIQNKLFFFFYLHLMTPPATFTLHASPDSLHTFEKFHNQILDLHVAYQSWCWSRWRFLLMTKRISGKLVAAFRSEVHVRMWQLTSLFCFGQYDVFLTLSAAKSRHMLFLKVL